MPTQRDPLSELSPRIVAEHLKEEGKERIERGKASAADQVDHVADALRSAGDELGGQSALGNYANQFAGSIGRLGRRLRDSRVEDLAGDLQAAARRNPTMFLLGGVALGLVLARLVKASAPEDDTYTDDDAGLANDASSGGDEDEWPTGGTDEASFAADALGSPRSDFGASAAGSPPRSAGE